VEDECWQWSNIAMDVRLEWFSSLKKGLKDC